MKHLLLVTAMWAALISSSAVADAATLDPTWLRADETGVWARTTDGVEVRKTCQVFEDDSYLCGYFKPEQGYGWEIDMTLPHSSGCFPGGFCQDYIENCPNGLKDVECFDFVTGG